MSVMNDIKRLEKEKQELVKKAKSDALDRAKQAIKDLRDLGFEYHLVEDGGIESAATPKATRGPAKGSTQKRRKGMRENVRKAIAASSNGMSRKELIAAFNAKETRDKTAVSNALAILKKENVITLESGNYAIA